MEVGNGKIKIMAARVDFHCSLAIQSQIFKVSISDISPVLMMIGKKDRPEV